MTYNFKMQIFYPNFEKLFQRTNIKIDNSIIKLYIYWGRQVAFKKQNSER